MHLLRPSGPADASLSKITHRQAIAPPKRHGGRGSSAKCWFRLAKCKPTPGVAHCARPLLSAAPVGRWSGLPIWCSASAAADCIRLSCHPSRVPHPPRLSNCLHSPPFRCLPFRHASLSSPTPEPAATCGREQRGTWPLLLLTLIVTPSTSSTGIHPRCALTDIASTPSHASDIHLRSIYDDAFTPTPPLHHLGSLSDFVDTHSQPSDRLGQDATAPLIILAQALRDTSTAGLCIPAA